MTKKEILAELLNAIFDDHEGNIEHVDMSYKEFVKKLKQLSSNRAGTSV